MLVACAPALHPHAEWTTAHDRAGELLANVGTPRIVNFLKVNETAGGVPCTTTYLNPQEGGLGPTDQGFVLQPQSQGDAAAAASVKLASTRCTGMCVVLKADGSGIGMDKCSSADALWTKTTTL